MTKPDRETEAAVGNQGKIGMAEGIIMGLMAMGGDGIEIFGGLVFGVPYVGTAIWLFCYFFGLLISAALFGWTLFRGNSGHVAGKYVEKKMARKLLVMGISLLIDTLTGGPIPMKTVGVIATILVNNHMAQRDVKEETGKATKGVKKAAGLIFKYGGRFIGI